MKILEISSDINSVNVTFVIKNKTHTLFVRADNKENKQIFNIKNLDFFIPFATVLSLVVGEDIDLNNYKRIFPRTN